MMVSGEYCHDVSTCKSYLQVLIWAASWQNQQNDLCAQRRLKSSAQADQSLRSTLTG